MYSDTAVELLNYNIKYARAAYVILVDCFLNIKVLVECIIDYTQLHYSQFSGPSIKKKRESLCVLGAILIK